MSVMASPTYRGYAIATQGRHFVSPHCQICPHCSYQANSLSHFASQVLAAPLSRNADGPKRGVAIRAWSSEANGIAWVVYIDMALWRAKSWLPDRVGVQLHTEWWMTSRPGMPVQSVIQH